MEGIKCGVLLVSRFYVFLNRAPFRMLSDVGTMALPTFVVSVSERLKEANCLKNRQKSLVDSDFLCIFARYLCVLRPRMRVI